MKKLLLTAVLLVLSGCQSLDSLSKADCSQEACPKPPEQKLLPDTACLGNTDLPANMQGKLTKTTDQALLQRALGEANQGKLCQGAVYEAKADVTIQVYRAWNSTNPGSEYSQWWAAEQPQNRIADYRTNYEICYQWSPLDKLTQCTLKAGTKVVIGTGQSASCSQYLAYPVSASKQIYIENAKENTSDCGRSDAVFAWQPLPSS